MSLAAGTRLGHYEITSAIGKGGMGEVWRAKDTKLGRDVAIKVLPEEFTKDAERLARSEREARILASLEHSNIASIYGLEEVDGVRFLAMQLAAGEDLSKRLSRGAIPPQLTVAARVRVRCGRGTEIGSFDPNDPNGPSPSRVRSRTSAESPPIPATAECPGSASVDR